MGIMLVVLAILFLFVLTYLVSLLSNKFKIPVAIVGIIAGLLLSGVFKFAQSLQLPADYLPTLALLAFVLLVFDASAEIKLKTADSTAFGAIPFFRLAVFLSAEPSRSSRRLFGFLPAAEALAHQSGFCGFVSFLSGFGVVFAFCRQRTIVLAFGSFRRVFLPFR